MLPVFFAKWYLFDFSGGNCFMGKQLLVKLLSSKETYGFGFPPAEERSAIIGFLHHGPTLQTVTY